MKLVGYFGLVTDFTPFPFQATSEIDLTFQVVSISKLWKLHPSSANIAK
jgi:hypothetical protein